MLNLQIQISIFYVFLPALLV